MANGYRVIRTIAFDILIGDEVIVAGKTAILRSIDLEQNIAEVEFFEISDDTLREIPLKELPKKVRRYHCPIEQVVGNNRVTVNRDKILSIGDIPYDRRLDNDTK